MNRSSKTCRTIGSNMGVSNWKRPFLFPSLLKGFPTRSFKSILMPVQRQANIPILWYSKIYPQMVKCPIQMHSKAYSKVGQMPHSKVFKGLYKEWSNAPFKGIPISPSLKDQSHERRLHKTPVGTHIRVTLIL